VNEIAKPASLTPVKMGIPVFGVNFIPFILARDQGIYQEEGLKVDFIVMSATAAMAATVSEAIEFNGFAGTTLGAAMQGAPMRLVLALSRKPKYWIFSVPEVKSVTELAGKTLAVGTRGSGVHVYTLFILEKLGLAGKVQVLPMAGFAARSVVTSLLSGQVQAGYASDSTYFELKDRG
jgi:ABC-type nitrate/sulfonate/bicarbonate transport system substrate-binding protein